MNAYTTKKESIRVYQGGRKEQVRKRHCGKYNESGSSGNPEGVYGQLIREFLGTQVDNGGMMLFPAENLV